MALDLTTIAFTNGDDDAIFSDILAIIAGPAEIDAIFNDALVNTRKGDDLIDGRLSGTVETADSVSVNGIRSDSPDGLLTGAGEDEIFGEADFAGSHLALDFTVTGILGGEFAEINTGKDDDSITGRGIASGKVLDVAGIRDGTYLTASGEDIVTGSAEGTGGSTLGESAINGITDAVITTGTDDDAVHGEATGFADDGVDGFFVEGIEGGVIITGDGRDDVTGDATATLGDDAMGVFLNGLDDLLIETRLGNDKVIGTSVLTMVDNNAVSADGIDDSEILTGDGRDEIIGSVEIEGEDESNLTSVDGIDNSDIFSGEGNDQISGSVAVTVGDDANFESVDGLDQLFVRTGDGRDDVIGSTDIEVGADARIIGSDGIDDSDIDTGDGNDKIIGTTSIKAGDESDVVDADGIDLAFITTGEGRDLVEGRSEIDVVNPDSAFGSGIILSIIETGDNADEVIGIGADVAVDGDSFGIAGSSIGLGSGDDEVMARGASAGVFEAIIFGDAGDDIFDLHSGVALVSGGMDEDLLILAGDSTEFTFTNNGAMTGNITDGNGTDMDVIAIEEFQFDDGTFVFGDLF